MTPVETGTLGQSTAWWTPTQAIGDALNACLRWFGRAGNEKSATKPSSRQIASLNRDLEPPKIYRNCILESGNIPGLEPRPEIRTYCHMRRMSVSYHPNWVRIGHSTVRVECPFHTSHNSVICPFRHGPFVLVKDPPFGREPTGEYARPSCMTHSLTHRVASVATALSALLVGAAGVTVGLMAYMPADAPLRTVELGTVHESQAPADWTARVIRDGWAATDAGDRARACKATPAQLRAAAPHTSYDPARYDVETAIRVLADLCSAAVPACPQEDSPGPCYWNAATRGNGKGQSFTVRADGTVTYK